MRPLKNQICCTAVMLSVAACFAQHPDFAKIDSLKNILPGKKGIERIDCLNAIAIEYWWPSMTRADTITRWATIALKEANSLNYFSGRATSTMLLGVAEIFRKNFKNAEKYLREALEMFEEDKNSFGLGWCQVWLGHALYSQNRFDEALAFQKKSVLYFERSGDWEGEGKTWSWIGLTYSVLGDFDSSFYYSGKSLLIRQKLSDFICVALSFFTMGQLYKAAGSYDDAADFYEKGAEYAKAHNINNSEMWSRYFELMGNLYRLKNFPDSSSYFLEHSLHADSTNETVRMSIAETQLLKRQPDSALTTFLKTVDGFKKGNDQWDLMRVLLGAAKALAQKGNNKQALAYATESNAIAIRSRAKQFIDESYLWLSKIYSNLHNSDSSLFFLQKYTALKDTIVSNQFLWKLSIYKKNEAFKKQMNELSILEKENRIKEAKLKEDSLLRWILIGFFMVAAAFGIIFYKNLSLKRKNEKLESKNKHAQLQQHVSEVEMQALRAQMNPHFIFNCLSSINHFILVSETEQASNYLTKFSRLIRMVLINSKRSFISIEEEMDMLRIYLDMEKLRFENAFDYSIICHDLSDTGTVFIPPLLLQPFVENAIWHGLMHKNGHGNIEIRLSAHQNILTCIITDDGIGRTKAAEIKSKSAKRKKSMGLEITRERLALLNQDIDKKTFFQIEDLLDDTGQSVGTRVILRVHYKNIVEAEKDKYTVQ